MSVGPFNALIVFFHIDITAPGTWPGAVFDDEDSPLYLFSRRSRTDDCYFEGSWYVISGHTASPAPAFLTIPGSPVF